ncbi:MAG: hypothetical protein E6Q97_14125 [Desulfurellales bacterium]|nr:MAG: hypothetical protein E6Q97_14125 [Desulfurellales bacterium]
MKTSVDYDTALAAMLKRLQDAFYTLLEIHRDETHLNPDSAKAKKTKQEFDEANAAIFRFKEAWHEIQGALNDKK